MRAYNRRQERQRGCRGSTFSASAATASSASRYRPSCISELNRSINCLTFSWLRIRFSAINACSLPAATFSSLLLPRMLDFHLPPRRLAQRRLQHVDQLVAHVGIQLGGLPHLLQRQLQLLRGHVGIRAHQRPGLADGVLHFGLDHLRDDPPIVLETLGQRAGRRLVRAGPNQVQIADARRPPAGRPPGRRLTSRRSGCRQPAPAAAVLPPA